MLIAAETSADAPRRTVAAAECATLTVGEPPRALAAGEGVLRLYWSDEQRTGGDGAAPSRRSSGGLGGAAITASSPASGPRRPAGTRAGAGAPLP